MCLFVCDNRGSMSCPLYERWPVEDSGRSRRLCAATFGYVLHWGSLCHLLWQGPLLCVQHQRETTGTYGGGRQHQGKHEHKLPSVRLCRIERQANELGSSRMSVCPSFFLLSFHFCYSACVLSCQLSGVWLNVGMICLQALLFPLSISLSLSFSTLRVQICPLICRATKCHSTCMCVWECARERNGQRRGLLH